MKRNIILSALFVFAIIAYTGFAGSALAGGSGDQASPLASTTIVISQVYGGGGATSGTPTYTKDYVELKNISNSPQSLNGLSLYYGSSTGQFASSTGNAYLLGNVTLQPGQYYLVALGPVGTVGGALPVTADETTANLTLSAASGKVALVSGLAQNSCGATATPCTLPNAQIIDLVSYGAANNAEGGASVNNNSPLTNVQGAVRKANGCTDTDNNNNDFDVVTAPTPRNSQTTAAPCGGGGGPIPDSNVDMNGDGKTDYVVIRGTGQPLTGISSVRQRMAERIANRNSAGGGVLAYWYVLLNGTNTFYSVSWGDATTDTAVPEDYDGDGKDDIAIWRAGDASTSAFYILHSADNTFRIVPFGDETHDPTVTGDYDGDNKADPATYWCSLTTPGSCQFGYLSSVTSQIVVVQWGFGVFGDNIPAPGDYDGDGKYDFCVQREKPGSPGIAQFALLTSTGATEFIDWGVTTDVIEPGDYDGDNKNDFMVARLQGNVIVHYLLTRAGSFSVSSWGAAGDIPTPGDYNGDGRDDISVFRPAASPNSSTFYTYISTNGSVLVQPWGNCQAGQPCDVPAANWYVH